MKSVVTREEARNMSSAHADGLHDEAPRQFCPDCEDRPLSSYPSDENVVGSALISSIESAINNALIHFTPQQHPQLRKALLDARGNIREAIGEARS